MAIRDPTEIIAADGLIAAVAATDRMAFWPTGQDKPGFGQVSALAQSFCKAMGLWFPLGGSNVAVSHTGDTLETTLATLTIPADSIGPNGALRIFALFSNNSNANNKTPRIKFNGTVYYFQNFTTNIAGQILVEIGNRNSASLQIAAPDNFTGFGGTTDALVTSSHNTATPLDVTITGQLANTGDSIAVERWRVEVLYRA